MALAYSLETPAPTAEPAVPLLSVRGLTTSFSTPEGPVRAVNDVTFRVEA